MGTHPDARYHAHGQNHLADAGKPRALKGACVVWRGAFGQSTISPWQLARCLPYPGSIRRAFREKVKGVAGRGRSRLQAWPEIVIGTVIKKTAKKRVVEVIRRLTQGGAFAAIALLAVSQGGKQLNTAFIERLNATFRERLASLTRRCRHAARKVSRLQAGMWLVGCTYNFCWPHHELSRRAARTQDHRGEVLLTPAMASGLTDHVWSVRELLTVRIPPPAWIAPKRGKRASILASTGKKPRSARIRPLLRLRKGALCAPTI
jgi:hypothetical protein